MLSQHVCRVALIATLFTGTANAKNDELTYAGAVKAASSDGFVPAWNKPSPTDIKDNEQPLFSITKANLKEHGNKLSHGARTMLETIPDYRIDVYSSHRTAIVPDDVEQNMKRGGCRLINDGNGVSPCLPGSPFVLPANGLEAIWNHLLRFRGKSMSNVANRVTIFPNNVRSLYKARQDTLYIYGQAQDKDDDLNDILYMTRSRVIEPVTDAFTLYLARYTVDQTEKEPAFWQYFPGPRRVKRMPVSSHNFIVDHSYGFLTQDSLDMFNGAPDYYSWTLVERKEMVIPYNNRALAQSFPSDELLLKTNLNPSWLRFEHHRVWVVDADLKDGCRHIYKKRRFYLDEDSWQIVMADLYGSDNNLMRYQEAYPFVAWSIPALIAPITAIYDFNGKGYLVDGLNDDGDSWDFNAQLRSSDFTPAALRRRGR